MRTLLVPVLAAGNLRLDGEEAHHGRTVLRLAIGDTIRLADGRGLAAAARVVDLGRHHLDLDVEAPTPVVDGPARHLTLAFAPPKGDRLGDTVRALTELGVGRIRLLDCTRGERFPQRLDRLERIAAEALKQCRRGHLPVLLPLVDIPTLASAGERCIVLDRHGTPPSPGPVAPVTLVVGPEGGLTDDELAILRASGAGMVRLATPVLRIETAACAAAAVWAAAWEAL